MSKAQEVIRMYEQDSELEIIVDVFDRYGHEVAGAVRNIQGSFDVRVFYQISPSDERAIRKELSKRNIQLNDVYFEG